MHAALRERERITASRPRVPKVVDGPEGPVSPAAPLSEGSAPPARSHDQRMAALEAANVVRSHRAILKRELKAGHVHVAELLDDPLCSTMKLSDVLLALPKIGRVKANRFLIKHTISPSKTLGGLSERQRGEISAVDR